MAQMQSGPYEITERGDGSDEERTHDGVAH
jgi:hypothetical protein